jgi:hypothetical protein
LIDRGVVAGSIFGIVILLLSVLALVFIKEPC